MIVLLIFLGSFHPVSDDQWFAGVYLSDDDVAVQRLCTAAFTNTVPEQLDDVSKRVIDHCDPLLARPAIVWAALAGNTEAAKRLLNNGATPLSRDTTGHTAVLQHVAFLLTCYFSSIMRVSWIMQSLWNCYCKKALISMHRMDRIEHHYLSPPQMRIFIDISCGLIL